MIFSLADKVGALEEALKTFASHGVNLTRIESRPSQAVNSSYDFFVDLESKEEADVSFQITRR